MDDCNDSALDDYLDSLSSDLESLKGNLGSIERDLGSLKGNLGSIERDLGSLKSGYKEVSERCQHEEQDYAVLEKCAKDYKSALELLLRNYGELLTLSLDPEESGDDIKKRIQKKLENMKDRMAEQGINLQYQIPGEQYVEPTDGESSLKNEDTTDKDSDGIVKIIKSIGLNSGNIRGDREIRESTVVYRYRDSSDSSISDTSAKEGAPTTDGVISKQSSADSDSRNTGAGSGNQEETSHEADSTNQTDENRHALAYVDTHLCLIGMEWNPDGKYELPLDESFHVGISDCTIAILKVSVATDLKITLTEDDTSLSLELAPSELAPGGISLAAYDKKISYDTYTLEKQNTGSSGTNVTYKKIPKPIEYYARVTNIENSKDVKLEFEINWESPKLFVRVVDGELFCYRPSMDKWSTEPTESVVKYIADYRMEDIEGYARDLYDDGMKNIDRVTDKIYEQILPSGNMSKITKTFIKSKIQLFWSTLKKTEKEST